MDKLPYIELDDNNNPVIILNRRFHPNGWITTECIVFWLDIKWIWYMRPDDEPDWHQVLTWDEAQEKAGDFDLLTLAKYGVKRWEFDEPIKTNTGSQPETSPELQAGLSILPSEHGSIEQEIFDMATDQINLLIRIVTIEEKIKEKFQLGTFLHNQSEMRLTMYKQILARSQERLKELFADKSNSLMLQEVRS